MHEQRIKRARFGQQAIRSTRVEAKEIEFLRVKGDSMKDAHILSGDLALIRQQPTAENGEIVVARVHQSDATLKRFFRRASRIVLKAENPKYDPIEAAGNDVEVVGKLIGIYRKVV